MSNALTKSCGIRMPRRKKYRVASIYANWSAMLESGYLPSLLTNSSGQWMRHNMGSIFVLELL